MLISLIRFTIYTKYCTLFFRCGTILVTFVLISGRVAHRGTLDEDAMNCVRRSCIPEVHPIKLSSTWHKTHLSESIATVRSRVRRLRFYAIGGSAIKSRSHDQDPTHGIKRSLSPHIWWDHISIVHSRSDSYREETSIHRLARNQSRRSLSTVSSDGSKSISPF